VLTLLGLRAAHRLESDGPEILLALRSGRTHAKGVGRARNFSRANQLRITLSASLGVIALLPQSIVPAMFLISGSSERVWFYALYLTPGWRWPAILLNATVGLGALAYALYVYRSARHAQTQANRSESG
jgi:ABC-2 type transport system permease protein